MTEGAPKTGAEKPAKKEKFLFRPTDSRVWLKWGGPLIYISELNIRQIEKKIRDLRSWSRSKNIQYEIKDITTLKKWLAYRKQEEKEQKKDSFILDRTKPEWVACGDKEECPECSAGNIKNCPKGTWYQYGSGVPIEVVVDKDGNYVGDVKDVKKSRRGGYKKRMANKYIK